MSDKGSGHDRLTEPDFDVGEACASRMTLRQVCGRPTSVSRSRQSAFGWTPIQVLEGGRGVRDQVDLFWHDESQSSHRARVQMCV